MAIYFVGDTHSGLDEKKLYAENFPDYNLCTKDDILIQLGDFGYIWNGSDDEVLRMKNVFENKNWGDVLTVLGNHENYELISKYPIVEKYGGKVRQLSENIYSMLRGEIYVIDGYSIFAFGGATSTDIEQREINKTYWLEEDFTDEEKKNALNNLKKYNYKVDIIVTHTCSESTLYELIRKNIISKTKLDNHNKFFEELKEIIDYKHWLFGHFHRDININEKESVLYNRVVKVDTNLNYKDISKCIKFDLNNDYHENYDIFNIIEIAKYGVSINTYNKNFKIRKDNS